MVVSAHHPAAARLFRLRALNPGPDFAGRRRERGRGRRPERGRRLLAELVRAHLVSEHAKALLAYAGKLPHAERLHSTEGSVRGRLLTVTRNLIVDRMRSASARHETVGADDRDVPLPDHADAVLTSVEATSMLRQLSRDHREVLVHTYLCGRTATERLPVDTCCRLPRKSAQPRMLDPSSIPRTRKNPGGPPRNWMCGHPLSPVVPRWKPSRSLIKAVSCSPSTPSVCRPVIIRCMFE
ncbi:UNVERIFIED_CONTAM: hypothetical protein RKD50_008075 [Streptomyces canus]